MKETFYIFYLFSDIEQKTFSHLSKLCRKGCDNCFPGVPRKFLTNFFSEIFTFFRRTREKILPSGRKIFVVVVKTKIYVSIATFWWQKTFLGKIWIFYNIYGLPAKLVRPFVGILAKLSELSIGTFLWQVSFAFEWVFHDFYGLWVKKFLLFVVKLMAGLSKLHHTCP